LVFVLPLKRIFRFKESTLENIRAGLTPCTR
jgi:hypothetical protein